MKKIVTMCAAALMMLAMLAGCGSAEKTNTESVTSTTAAEKTNMNVCAIAGPTGVGLVSLMAAQDAGTASNAYTFSVVSEPTEAVAAITNGSADIAAVPTNLAATLYKKTQGKVQVLAVNTLGVLYMLENGTSITSVADLRGQTIYTTGQGANPEYILRYVLEKNGLNPDTDVTISFVSDNDTLTTMVADGSAKVAMVPEPKATACLKNNPAVRVALSMTDAWDAVAGGQSKLMMGCVIARTEFVQTNAAAVKAFLKEYETSVNTVKGDATAAADQCVQYGVIPKAPIAVAAIPNCNLTFVTGNEMKTQLSGYLKVLFDYNASSIGGEMPADAFYYAG